MEKIKILGGEIDVGDAIIQDKLITKYRFFELECIRYLGQTANSSKVEFLFDFWRGIGLVEWLFLRHILEYITELLNNDGYENIDIDYYFQNYLGKYYASADVWHNGRVLIKTAIEKITELFEINNDYEAHHIVNELSKGDWDKKWFGLCTDVYHRNFNGKEIPDYIEAILDFLDELEYCDDILYCECSADQFLKAVDFSRLKKAVTLAEIDFIEKTRGYELAEYFPDKSTEITDKLKNIKTADEEVKKQIIEAIKLAPDHTSACKRHSVWSF